MLKMKRDNSARRVIAISAPSFFFLGRHFLHDVRGGAREKTCSVMSIARTLSPTGFKPPALYQSAVAVRDDAMRREINASHAIKTFIGFFSDAAREETPRGIMPKWPKYSYFIYYEVIVILHFDKLDWIKSYRAIIDL